MNDLTYSDLQRYMWRKGDLEWKLWSQQIGIYRTIRSLPQYTETVVVLCARQYGKSFLGTLLAIEDCIRHPGFTVVVVGPTIQQTVDIVHQAVRLIEADAPEGMVRRSKSESRWYIGDSELVVGGFDVRMATRQRGKKALKVYVEEVVDSNPDEYREALRSDLGPMLTHSPEPQMVFLTTPPRVPDHPFLTETVPAAKLNNAFFSYTIDENSMLTPHAYDACVRRCGGRDTIEFRREYLCEIVRDQNIMVVPHFDKTRHISNNIEIPQHCNVQVTIDWGGTRDLTVALVHTYDFALDKDLIIDEAMWKANTPTDIIVRDLKALERKWSLVNPIRNADVPGQLSVDLMEIHDYETRYPVKADWQAGVNSMSLKFSMDKILLHERCKFLAQTLESGTFNKQRTDFDRTEALGHCDALAALSYAVRSQDRSNPWAPMRGDGQNVFRRPKDDDGVKALDEAIQPASFGVDFHASTYKAKRFGAFRSR